MTITAVLSTNDTMYTFPLELGAKVTVGSHKKDTVQVADFAAGQIVLQQKLSGVYVNARKAFGFEESGVPLDTIVVLDNASRTMLYLSSITGPCDRQVALPYSCILKVGRSDSNDVVIKLPFVSGSHFVLKNENGNVRVEDCNSTNGLYLNGKRVNIAKVHSGDVLQIFSVRITLTNGVLTFENVGDKLSVKEFAPTVDKASHMKKDARRLTYRRSPRTQDQLPTEDILLAAAPTKGQKYEKSRGMFSSLASSGAMMAVNMMTSAMSPALLAARAASLISPVTSAASSGSANKKRKQALEQYEAMRREKYGAYIDDQKARIASVAKVQRDILTTENPTPGECIDILTSLRRSLWERMPADRDFLDVRMGMGYEDLCVSVKSRSESGFQMESDEIRELAEQIVEETRIVDNIPARVPLLKKSTIGVVGDRDKTIQLIKNMLISLTTAHCYEDVRIVGIFDEKERNRWESLKWLPHVWNDNKTHRTLAFDPDSAHALCDTFNDMLAKRHAALRDSAYGDQSAPRPYYIFLFGSKELVEKEPIMQHLFTGHPGMGITSLFLTSEMYMLPNDCRTIIDVNNGPCIFDRDDANHRAYFTMDPATDDVAFDAFARRMSAVELDTFGSEAGLPNGITFLEGFGVKTVEQLRVLDRWAAAQPYKSLGAPIGKMVGNQDFFFDIHEKRHGPHGLVAGTTGSGKSELLQTWILSMALCYHPHDVSFVIIDYKGGGMANLLEPLPHVVGKITNIGSNIGRSLISLQSEIKRRYAIFEQYGVNHIDKYQKLYKDGKAPEPLPHLIIVSDEFAELKKEEPDFMSGLVSAARVGRSIGIHLVLATQKPGGVVDDQIQSNSRFRLCLKVADATDSREMLKRPDAASLTQAGRCYIRVGEDEYFDLFQSYWSGAAYVGDQAQAAEDDSNRVRIVQLNGYRLKTVQDNKAKPKSEMDELTAIIRYIKDSAEDAGIKALPGPWMPELPEVLPLAAVASPGCFDGQRWQQTPPWLQIPIGKYDAPRLQTQGVQYMDFGAEGHFGIYGASGTGKTTLLKSIVLSLGMHYTPADVNIYILDCGGWSMSIFSGMPHIGGIALDSEEEKFQKFEKLIWQEFESRKREFLKNAVSSLKAYRETVSQDMPAIVIAIDNIVPVFDLYPDMENLFVTIARDGATYGIYLVYTANSTTGVRYKVQQSIRGAMTFELTDKGDYANIVGRLEGMSLPKVLGRGFYKGNPPMEFQAAIFADGETDRDRSMTLKAITDRMNTAWTGKRPKPIPVMPETVTAQNLLSDFNTRTSLPLGISCEDIRPACVDLANNYSMVVAGSMRSGKSRMLATLSGLLQTRFPETKVFVFDSQAHGLQSLQDQAHRYTTVADDAAVQESLMELVGYLNERKKAQNQAHQIDGDRFDEKAFIQNYEQLCIIIDDLRDFVDSVSDNNKNAMERICRMAQDLGVIVLCAGRIADLQKYNEIESLTRVIIGNQNGLTLNGTPAQHSYFQNNLKYTDRDSEPGEGLSWLYTDGKCIKIKPIQ